jgi:hypothetical protein
MRRIGRSVCTAQLSSVSVATSPHVNTDEVGVGEFERGTGGDHAMVVDGFEERRDQTGAREGEGFDLDTVGQMRVAGDVGEQQVTRDIQRLEGADAHVGTGGGGEQGEDAVLAPMSSTRPGAAATGVGSGWAATRAANSAGVGAS